MLQKSCVKSYLTDDDADNDHICDYAYAYLVKYGPIHANVLSSSKVKINGSSRKYSQIILAYLDYNQGFRETKNIDTFGQNFTYLVGRENLVLRLDSSIQYIENLN